MVAHISNYSFTWSKGQKQWESQSASRLPPQPPLTQHCGRRRYTGRWGWPFRHLLRPLWSPLWRRKEPLDHPWSSRRKRSGHFALCWTAGGWFPHTPPAFQLLLLFQTWDHSRENIETVFCNVQLLRAWNSECETRKPIHPDFSYSSNARHDQQPAGEKIIVSSSHGMALHDLQGIVVSWVLPAVAHWGLSHALLFRFFGGWWIVSIILIVLLRIWSDPIWLIVQISTFAQENILF